MITAKDVEDVVDEMNAWSLDYAKRHDLTGENAVEGAAVAEATLKHLGIATDRELMHFIEGMTAAVIGRLVTDVLTRGPAGTSRGMQAAFGSVYMAGLSAGVMLGRKFPRELPKP